MTSQVEFFCSEDEENAILTRLAKDGARFSLSSDGSFGPWLELHEVHRSAWDEALYLLVWVETHGDLVWHESRPEATGSTHRSLVMNVLAQRSWESLNLSSGDRLLDFDRSPLMIYKRPAKRDGRWTPRSLLAPPANLENVGGEYARWVSRVLAWVRRRGMIVHDWRTPSEVIPNPSSIVNTVYALPEVLGAVRDRPEDYVIFSP